MGVRVGLPGGPTVIMISVQSHRHCRPKACTPHAGPEPLPCPILHPRRHLSPGATLGLHLPASGRVRACVFGRCQAAPQCPSACGQPRRVSPGLWPRLHSSLWPSLPPPAPLTPWAPPSTAGNERPAQTDPGPGPAPASDVPARCRSACPGLPGPHLLSVRSLCSAPALKDPQGPS